MIKFSKKEKIIANKIRELKSNAGSHSPSVFTLSEELPDLDIKIDACFLSNPYATNLFLEYLDKELIVTGRLRDVMEFYPSQNNVIGEVISSSLDLNKKNIFVGNGAIEIIQAVLHNFVSGSIVVNIPTFSSYYEFVNKNTKVIYYQLKKDEDYLLNPDDFIEFVKNTNPNSVVIINPNNPNGGYLTRSELEHILKNISDVKNIIIDESFIHFAYEDDSLNINSATDLFDLYSNLIIIKSMSKDFGIAGIRAGYAVMSEDKVSSLLENGFLWNSSGLSEYFFTLYGKKHFFKKYNKYRKKYILETQNFYSELSKINSIKIYPTKANFVLLELIDGSTSSDLVEKMLMKYGIYIRTGSDKIGLDGEFVRIASRTKKENEKIILAIKDIFGNKK
ncbi:MAG: aminotransferase [Candidatus Marinimicrobia bacterium]|nr:aminotransferase [Candidatus Neomarinimicrobiota bacterium]